jgi:hypothetical protein
MSYEPASADRSELTGIIRDIRKRWRVKLAVRGAAFIVGGRWSWCSARSRDISSCCLNGGA